MLIKKVLLFFLVVFYIIVGVSHTCHSTSNLSLGKKYTISVIPNYPFSAPATDASALTDGKYTKGHFWTRKTTVGWIEPGIVEILIDLEKISIIGEITFSTARGNHAGVEYPARVYAFVGSETDKLHFVGDVVRDKDNTPGPYATKKFVLKSFGVRGRYVLLRIIPNGRYVFCDEIEVLEGTGESDKRSSLTIAEARKQTETLLHLDAERDIWLHYLKELRESVENIENQNEALKSLEKFATLPIVSQDNVAILERELLKMRTTILKKKFPEKSLLIETVNPFVLLSPVRIPHNSFAETLSIVMPQNGVGFGTVVISNISSDTLSFSITIDKKAARQPDISIYYSPFIKSRAMKYVADPLVPLKEDLVLRSGESKVFVFESVGKEPGIWDSTFSVKSGSLRISIPIRIQVYSIRIPDALSFNGVNWAYLNFKPVRDKKSAAVRDLFAHHINVIVVPPEQLTVSSPVKTENFSTFETYLNYHKGASKILLFLGYNFNNWQTVNGKYEFMGSAWKAWFKDWYKEIIKTAAKAGFAQSQIYLYPFDEVRAHDINSFINFVEWARKELVDVQFYATLENENSFRVLPYLDIAQIGDTEKINLRALSSNAELWLYRGTSKAGSPYALRLMPWKAFFLDFKGAGFWSYADTGWGENAGTAWDDFDGKRSDFAVIYEGDDGTIISSRRWEAWRMGVEDYELLTMYARAKGEKVAKALTQEVLDNPDDASKADEVRARILKELSLSMFKDN